MPSICRTRMPNRASARAARQSPSASAPSHRRLRSAPSHSRPSSRRRAATGGATSPPTAAETPRGFSSRAGNSGLSEAAGAPARRARRSSRGPAVPAGWSGPGRARPPEHRPPSSARPRIGRDPHREAAGEQPGHGHARAQVAGAAAARGRVSRHGRGGQRGAGRADRPGPQNGQPQRRAPAPIVSTAYSHSVTHASKGCHCGVFNHALPQPISASDSTP